VLDLLRLDPVRALHQAYIVVREFVEPLGPVKPIITAFQFARSRKRIVPSVHREARQAETYYCRAWRDRESLRHILEAVTLQSINEKTREVAIFFGKCERIGKDSTETPSFCSIVSFE